MLPLGWEGAVAPSEGTYISQLFVHERVLVLYHIDVEKNGLSRRLLFKRQPKALGSDQKLEIVNTSG